MSHITFCHFSPNCVFLDLWVLISAVLKLHCADEDVTNMAVCILRSAIFKISGSSINNPREMEKLLPPLMDLLDERDGAARAVTVLIAEYCSM